MTTHSTIASSAEVAEASVRFADLDLHAKLFAQLNSLGFVTPTPIQQKAIPVVLEGHDVIGVAQTGTGKTLAFGLPIIHQYLTRKYSGRSLVILPTRELAIQVEETLRDVGGVYGLRTALLIGGAPMKPQQGALRQNPDVIVATPGRLIDHLQSGGVDLRAVETLVLDEADRMLDMGFEPQIRQILAATPPERQTLLFSATMPPPIVKIASRYMRNPVRVEVARPGTTAADISQKLFVVGQQDKNELLTKVLSRHDGTVLVFVRTRMRARRIARYVKKEHYAAAEIHSDRTLSQRRAALEGFKSGKYRILVATDIAARGIDVSDIELVVNFDLPDSAEDYVHRIGRTGRAGKSGQAVSFAAPDQKRDVQEIERLISTSLPISDESPTAWATGESAPKSSGRPARRSGRRPVRTAAATAPKPSRKKPAPSKPRKLSSLRRGRSLSQVKKP